MTRNIAAIILYSGDGKVLFQHRTDDAPYFPGYWGLFGGGIEKGETPEEAIRREIIEELSYVLKNPLLVNVIDLDEDPGYKLYVFAEKYDGVQTLQLLEGKDMKWFNAPELEKIKLIPHDKLAIESTKRKFIY